MADGSTRRTVSGPWSLGSGQRGAVGPGGPGTAGVLWSVDGRAGGSGGGVAWAYRISVCVATCGAIGAVLVVAAVLAVIGG